MQTPAPALYPPTIVALTSIFLTSRQLSLSLPLSPVPWWEHFDATEAELLGCAEGLLGLYRAWEGRGKVWEWAGKELPVDKSGVRRLVEGSNGRPVGQ